MSAKATAKGRRLSVAERRAQLLAVARGLLAERPWEAIAIDDLAEAAGISKGLVYHYFDGKQGLYRAVVAGLADELLAATRLGDDTDLEDGIRSALEAFFTFVSAHGRLYTALMGGGTADDPELAATIGRVRQTMLARILERLGVAHAPPPLRAGLHAWLGAVEALGLDQAARGDLTARERVALALSLLRAALSPPR